MSQFNRYLVSIVVGLAVSISAMAEVAVIVHPKNPVQSLTHKQVQRLFLGRSLMFPKTETKVYSIDQNEESPVFSHFYENVIQMNINKLKKYRAYYLFSGKGRLPLPLESSNEVIERVANNQNAISYVNINEVRGADVKVVFTMP